jgi:alkylation response protein AidB-like acyl-CoA dehydrogenase
MALILTEEQTMLRDSARAFMADNAPITQLRKLRDTSDSDGYSKPVWAKFADMGFTGVLVPEAQGGLGLGMVETGVVMEQIGHQLTASPFLASSVVAASLIRHAGTAEQGDHWLPKLVSGTTIATLAIDEHRKHQPDRIACKAAKTATGFTLEGHKTFVIDGHVADLLLVAATTSDKGITLFMVPRSTPGVSVERVAMVDSHNAARITFTGVMLGHDAVLGAVDAGAAPLALALDAGRAAAAAELLGIADEVFERTTAYLRQRKQFGRLIGEFQALQHRAAELYFDIEMARAAVLKALQAIDADPATAGEAVAVAKARAGTSATLAVQEGVQMHGGMGMTDEFDIGFFMKRARVLQEYLGDSGFHADRLASMRGY